MAFARKEHGMAAELRALASQIHPVFMLPPLAAALFGAAAAGSIEPSTAGLHMGAIFFAVYTAHVKDGYVDFYIRGEDDDHPLTASGCRVALVGSTIVFLVALAGLWIVVDPIAAILTAPTWLLGYLHAPHFDTNPITATLDYPAGIGVAIIGGYYIQAGTLTTTALGFATVFVVLLAGVSIIDDEQDYAYDREIGKQTAAVLLGPKPGRELAVFLMMLGMIGVLWGTVSGVFPPASPLGAVAFGAVAVVAVRSDPETATMLLVRGAYLFLAVLFVAVWFQPLSGAGLPDITVFGPYTYLITELFFGGIALVLLYRANAIRTAARTIVVLYPIAYIWDWYTLEVGVFDIIKRTGIDLFGIPIEEHLFMIVVPALVIGIHETLRASQMDSHTQERQ